MKFSRFILFLALNLGSTLASASILVDRGLPDTSGANGGVGGIPAARSNVSWGNQDGFINGDNFYVTGQWSINRISTWMVGDPTRYTNYVLYGGVTGVSFGIISAPDPVITREYYQSSLSGVPCNTASGANYLAPDGVQCFQINRITFEINSLMLTAGALFNFAADATPTDACEVGGDTTGCFYAHATNAALAGTTQDSSDNFYISFDSLNLDDGDPIFIDSNGNGWDKSSDINVRVEGAVVPEPSTIPLILIGIAAIGVLRRRK